MDYWVGYPRPDGSYGVRNIVAILPTVSCANVVCDRIASYFDDNVVSLSHNTGCALLERGFGMDTQDILINVGLNPNIHSVLVVGLGCETVNPDVVADGIMASGKPVERILIQDVGSQRAVELGRELVTRLLNEAEKIRRRSTDVSTLIVGVECGGSDWTSGVLSNPSVGYASDKLVGLGGTVILGETTELIGAEHILIDRAVSDEVGLRIRWIIDRYIKDIGYIGGSVYGSNPSRGNIEGGLSTIEEKALGAICKGGFSKIVEVVDYGVRPSKKGVVIMDTPGYDIASITGMIAGGAQIIVFTTGRGSPTGSLLSPTIKVTGNPWTYMKMKDDIDINVGEILLMKSLPGQDYILCQGERIYEMILDVASGHETKSESYRYNNLYFWRRGMTL